MVKFCFGSGVCAFFFFALIPARKRGSLFTELRFRVGFRFGFRVGFSSWIFELGFFGGFFFLLVGFPINLTR